MLRYQSFYCLDCGRHVDRRREPRDYIDAPCGCNPYAFKSDAAVTFWRYGGPVADASIDDCCHICTAPIAFGEGYPNRYGFMCSTCTKAWSE